MAIDGYKGIRRALGVVGIAGAIAGAVVLIAAVGAVTYGVLMLVKSDAPRTQVDAAKAGRRIGNDRSRQRLRPTMRYLRPDDSDIEFPRDGNFERYR